MFIPLVHTLAGADGAWFIYKPQIEVHFQGEFRVGDRGVEMSLVSRAPATRVVDPLPHPHPSTLHAKTPRNCTP